MGPGLFPNSQYGHLLVLLYFIYEINLIYFLKNYAQATLAFTVKFSVSSPHSKIQIRILLKATTTLIFNIVLVFRAIFPSKVMRLSLGCSIYSQTVQFEFVNTEQVLHPKQDGKCFIVS